MKKDYPDYIVVEGPIGVGKTTLARRLAKTFDTESMLELVAENPFLPQFYADPKSAALPTQLYFLFQRTRQIELLRQVDIFKPIRVTDFFIEKDKLFATATLTDNELALYNQVYAHLALNTPVPDLVIYLQAPVDLLMQRIIERGHDYEQSIDRQYLKKISDSYIDFFYYYTKSPLLIVNTNDFDLSNNDEDYQLLLKHIRALPPGKHYLNAVEL